MNAGRIRPFLFTQYFLLLFDMFSNSFSELWKIENIIQLVTFVVQDVCILFNIIIMFLMFFNTYVFQAGLINILVKQFRITIVVSFLYLGLSIGYHICLLTLRWGNPEIFIWSTNFKAFFIIHRLIAVFYYYYYKRTAVSISDPKFYKDSDWIRSQMTK